MGGIMDEEVATCLLKYPTDCLIKDGELRTEVECGSEADCRWSSEYKECYPEEFAIDLKCIAGRTSKEECEALSTDEGACTYDANAKEGVSFCRHVPYDA